MESYMNECIDVNVKGVMNTIIPFINQMKVISINTFYHRNREKVNFVLLLVLWVMEHLGMIPFMKEARIAFV